MPGFLGKGAPFSADLNLVVQLAMGLALVAGAVLARCKLYRPHAICQTTVLLLNVVMIALVMWPSFREQVAQGLPRHLRRPYYFVDRSWCARDCGRVAGPVYRSDRWNEGGAPTFPLPELEGLDASNADSLVDRHPDRSLGVPRLVQSLPVNGETQLTS
jgi:hypothetical protein